MAMQCYKCKKDALKNSNYCEDHQPANIAQKKSLEKKDDGESDGK